MRRIVFVVFAMAASTGVSGDGIVKAGWIDFNKNGKRDVYEDPSAKFEDRVADLLGQMTLSEKICQLVTLYGSGRVLRDAQPTPKWKDEVWKDGIANIDEELNGVGRMYKLHPDLTYPYANHVRAINAIQRWFVEETRLGIPVDFTNEGIHGLNHTKATALPAPIGIGSTWNRALVREAGEVVGAEAKLIGYSNVYAPILDLARDPRWGRVLECYGEDPYHVAELGVEMAAGIQSQGVISTVKHYAVYSVPLGGRDGNARTDPHVTPRDLHEIFLYPFAEVFRRAKPLGVMCSYNDWNGEPVASSHYFLWTLLREKYGFDGYVVSDSDAVEYVHDKHAVAETYADGARMTVEAGLNVHTNFREPKEFVGWLHEQYAAGKLTDEVIDARVSEVLSVKFRIGLFDNPYLGDEAKADWFVGLDKHLDFHDRIQEESLVLLKNTDAILPLNANHLKKVLVAGPLADETNYMISRYGPNGLECTSILKGIRDYAAGRFEVVYEMGCVARDAKWPESELCREPATMEEESQLKAATAAAQDADCIIAVLGEDLYCSGESRSRTDLALPGRQEELLERLYATGKPVVLVLVNGQPLTINFAAQKLPAILEAWWPSVRGGAAVAKALFGDVNPSGKLSVTFPKTVGQLEYCFPYRKGARGAQPKWAINPNGYGHTRAIGELFPFGHGLSYTKFIYSDLQLGENKVVFTLTNSGDREGAEVVQLYVRDKFSSLVAFDSVLRGFEKVCLKPGESKRVEFKLSDKDLAIMDRNLEWVVEPGEFEIMLGSSSKDIRLRGTLKRP